MREIWLVDPAGIDQRRGEMGILLRRLQRNGLSRFEPGPVRAWEAAEQRQRELGVATEPSGDAA
jgi:hypothetical protein